MKFEVLAGLIQKQFDEMSKTQLYVVNLEKDQIWEKYLDSFPEGTNKIYRERREYDCSCCRQFINRVGNVVSIVDGKLVSVWDVAAESYYKEVTEALSAYVKSQPIKTVFMTNERKAGAKTTKELLESGAVKTWNHYHCDIPAANFDKDYQTKLSKINSTKDVFERGLEELKLESLNITLDLIMQNSLYRGEEFKDQISAFKQLKTRYEKLTSEKEKNIFIWQNVKTAGSRIRNSAIGTLLQDLSEDFDISDSVTSFETKVSAGAYKRKTKLITNAMIERDMKIVQDLGIEPSLYRKYAHIEDVSVNNVLFTDHTVQPLMKDGLKDLLKKEAKSTKTNFDKVEEISIDDFIEKVLPTSESIELFVENKHIPNLCSLIAPTEPEAPNILKWENNFSWSYKGGVTDSLKEKVVSAGGRVDGVFRFTHSWNEIEPNESLMDLHVFMPGCTVPSSGGGPNVSGRRIGWNHREDTSSGGVQDVDYTSEAPKGYIPVENITFPNIKNMPDGVYTCKIHNWNYRNSGGRGKAEIEISGELYQYEYPATKNHQWITVAEVTLKNGIFTIKHHIEPGTSRGKEIWNINTQKFQKVNTIMYSPNFWDENKKGNKHFMFMLDKCKNPDDIIGLYNEFLNPNLGLNSAVFEVLSTKLKCEYDDNQLSGIGFSSTLRNEVIAKVSGAFNRMLKIKF